MAFVCTITPEAIEEEYFVEGESHIVFVHVGVDADRGLSYFVSVGFEPIVGGELEYFFNLIERDLAEDAEHTYWSGRNLPVSISPSDREMILKAVLHATERLIDTVRPAWVFRCTRDGYSGLRGLAKHDRISQVFIAAGYRLHVADPFGDKRCWWMEREDQS